MDGISRTQGVGGLFTIGGQSFTVNGKILRHYAEIEAEIRKQRGNPLLHLRELLGDLASNEGALTAVVVTALQSVKRDNFVSLGEIGEFLSNTMTGRCMSVWLAIRQHDPKELTFSKVSQMFCDEFERQMNMAPKLDDKGNPTEPFGYDRAEGWWNEFQECLKQAEGVDQLGNSTGSPSQ